ncbi:MAG: TrkA C-terminal domain-containing protein [Planctomycetota bacterium]
MHEFLQNQPVIVLCLVLASGYLVGLMRFRGIGLGSVTGVLFAGLVFGHWGFVGDPILQSVGFAFFMYVVGYEAGPRMFAVVRQDGLRYAALVLVIAGSGFGTAYGVGRLLGLPTGAIAGALAGGLTTTPTLAAAQSAVTAPDLALGEGVSTEQVLANINGGYAITYLVGLIGLIVLIKLVPRFTGLDLAAAAAEAESGDPSRTGVAPRPVVTRAYRVRGDSVLVGKPLREVEARVDGRVRCFKVRRGGEMLDPDAVSVTIEAGDELAVIGLLTQVKKAAEEVGPELDDSALLDVSPESAEVVVMRRDAAHKTLAELGVASTYGAIVSAVKRGDAHLEPAPDLEVQRGDVLTATAPGPHLERLGKALGHVERDIEETDLLTMMLGIAAGVAIGAISITVWGVPLSLGVAGGTLLCGVVLGALRSVSPVFGRVPAGARWFIMEVGLLVFMSGVGLSAGASILETLRSSGLPLVLTGAAVMVVPVAAGLVVGLGLMKMNPALLLGGITGAMTSTAAMRVVCGEAKSNVPALGYAGAYAIANIVLALCGYLIVRLEV